MKKIPQRIPPFSKAREHIPYGIGAFDKEMHGRAKLSILPAIAFVLLRYICRFVGFHLLIAIFKILQKIKKYYFFYVVD
jgi:hypothetical protein